MSDTVKLIVEMPKEIYQDVLKNGFIYDEDGEYIADAIKNGTPLDDVKAEIESLPTEKIARCRKAYIFASEFKIKVLDILDNIGKADFPQAKDIEPTVKGFVDTMDILDRLCEESEE